MNRARICDVCGVHKNYCECKKVGLRLPKIVFPARKRCQAITRRPLPIGSPLPEGRHGRSHCKNYAIPGSIYCVRHKRMYDED